MTDTTNKDEINLGEVFKVLKRFKYSIISITLIATLLAAVFAYFSPNIYNSTASIYIKGEKKSSTKEDFMSMALGGQSNNIDNELDIITSKHIISKALEDLNIGIRYYTKNKLKKTELYKNAPFIVTAKSFSEQASKSIFHLEKIDNESFRLFISPSFKEKMTFKLKSLLTNTSETDKPIKYDKVCKYGKDIVTPWFIINVQRLYPFTNNSYTFTLSENTKMDEFIQKSLSASTVSKLATIIQLSFQDNVAARAQDILNAITNAYLEDELNYKKATSEKTLKFLDAQLKSMHAALKTSATSLEAYKTKNQVVNLTAKASLSAQTLADLQTQLYKLNLKESVYNHILTYINENKEISGITLGSSNADDAQADSNINAIILKIQKETLLKNSLLIDYTELHPDVLKVTKDLVLLKKSLKEAIISTLRNIKNAKATLKGIIKRRSNAISALPQQEREITELQRNFSANQHIYSFLQEKRAQTAIVQASTVSKTRVIDTATLADPDKPIKPKRALIVIVGFILGMIIGISLALFRNGLDNTVKTVEDIERQTDIPLYGAIPLFNKKRSSKQPYEEALRVVRTNLEFLYESNKPKLVTVTSSIPVEGKTTVTTEIAKIIAQSHKKVIVLDLDMRRAKVHEKYHLSNTKGMSTYLANQNSLMEVIQKTEFENLQVITAGPKPPNPSELIMTEKMTKTVQILLDKYDYVFLDTPPIGLVSDAMSVMKISDLSLFIIRANFSKKDFIKNINRMVEEHHLQNPGIILNGVEFSKNSGYGYGYGYAYDNAKDYYEKG